MVRFLPPLPDHPLSLRPHCHTPYLLSGARIYRCASSHDDLEATRFPGCWIQQHPQAPTAAYTIPCGSPQILSATVSAEKVTSIWDFSGLKPGQICPPYHHHTLPQTNSDLGLKPLGFGMRARARVPAARAVGACCKREPWDSSRLVELENDLTLTREHLGEGRGREREGQVV